MAPTYEQNEKRGTMTLFRQIVIIISFFQMIIFGAVLWQNFNTVNEFIQTQLGVDAKHTANSLGLSMTPYAASNDTVMMETMINSTFDSGYYELISLKDINGKIISQAKQDISIADVPSWFTSLISIEAPTQTSEIMAGWNQFGTLSIKNNVGAAYVQIWTTFKDVSLTFIIINLLAFWILYFTLKLILKPLNEVQKQAEAISGNDFILQKDLPKTIELKQVVGAMNSMVYKVKEIFEKEADAVEKYHNLLYKDVDLDIYNRRYFMLSLKNYLHDDGYSNGSLILLNLSLHDAIKSNLGFKKNEKFLKDSIEIFNKFTINEPNNIVAKLKDGEFAILLPKKTPNASETMCKNITLELIKIFSKYNLDTNKYFFSYGLVSYDSETDISDIFSKADFALSTAKSRGKFNTHIYKEENNDLILGKEGWREEIAHAMKEQRFIFVIQKAIVGDGEILHNEVFLRLEDKHGKIRNAGYFMPIVEELDLNDQIDKHVINSIIALLTDNDNLLLPISINLSKKMVLESENVTWLEDKLKEYKNKVLNPLSFEVSNRYRLPTSVLANFSRLLKKHGIEFGIDNFNLDGNSLKLLQEVNPSYIKVSASSLLDLFDNKNAEYSKQSLDIITSSMNIQIVAFGVSSEEEKQKLLNMGLHCMQGNFIQEPYLF